MCKRLITIHVAVLSVLCFMLILQPNAAIADQSEQQGSKYVLSDVKANIAENSLTITMNGSSQPAYTSRELYDPYRLIVDIAEVEFAKDLNPDKLLPENKFASLKTTIVRGLKPEITRFIFTITDGYSQKVDRKGNELVIDIKPMAEAVETTKVEAVKSGSSNEQVSAGTGKTSSNEAGAKIRELIESSAQPVEKSEGQAETTVADELAESFDFSGYKRERISIDFYKMDLHNVFRLFRQVSGLNLIVDESVSGSLTLALNDVPWDFALDTILNLAELRKEERFNTIIVYPKSKEFEWPKRTADNLSFETNLEVVQQEALIIEQSANQPKEIMQAKDLMRKAREKERNNDFEDAVELYEEAAALWPANSNLTSKLAAIYLVRLGMNAKGVYWAKKSLEAKPDNYNAALYAAIGMANMNKVPEAIEYFSQSISGNPPMKEALGSFAAFSESNDRPAAALKLFEKYESIYGESVNTMVAKARIYDNMGMPDKAVAQYRSVVTSGFQIPTGLKDYINSRLAE